MFMISQTSHPLLVLQTSVVGVCVFGVGVGLSFCWWWWWSLIHTIVDILSMTALNGWQFCNITNMVRNDNWGKQHCQNCKLIKSKLTPHSGIATMQGQSLWEWNSWTEISQATWLSQWLSIYCVIPLYSANFAVLSRIISPSPFRSIGQGSWFRKLPTHCWVAIDICQQW